MATKTEFIVSSDTLVTSRVDVSTAISLSADRAADKT